MCAVNKTLAAEAGALFVADAAADAFANVLVAVVFRSICVGGGGELRREEMA